MALTAQQIVDQVSTDCRKVLDKTNDAALVLDWVNRTNKDVMHNSVYATILQAIAAATYVANTTLVTVTLTTPRRVLSVYDKTWNRPLIPLERAITPVPSGEQAGPPGGPSTGFDISRRAFWPEFYAYAGGNNVFVYPAPIVAGSGADVFYEKTATDIAALGTTLDVPDDGKDIIVAGVNMLAAHYLKRIDEAKFWQEIYEKTKQTQVV